MRALCFVVVMASIYTAANAAEPSLAIYERDPGHLWNRLYEAIREKLQNHEYAPFSAGHPAPR